MPAHVSVSGCRANGDGFGINFDPFQFSQAPDAHQPAIRKFAGLEQDHQVGPSGHGTPDPGLASQYAERLIEAARSNQLVLRDVGSHDKSVTSDKWLALTFSLATRH